MMEKLLDKLQCSIAGLVPRWLVRRVIIRVWAHGTTGQWGHEEAPALLVAEALKRFDVAHQPKGAGKW